MFKKRIGFFVILTMVLMSSVASAKVLKFAHVYEPQTPYNKAALWVAEELKKQSNGRFEVQVFPSSQLGNEETITEGLQMGSIELAFTGPTFLGQFYPPMSISEAPFIWRDYDHWKMYQQSDVFKEVSQGYFQKTGNKVVSIVYFGVRQVTANRPIKTPADMKGMKIRVANATLWKIFPDAIGANPTPISFAEVYLALQQGVVAGQENPITVIDSNKFFEVQKTINLTGHITCSIVGMVGAPLWRSLNSKDKKLFDDVFKAASAKYSDIVHKHEQQLYEDFRRTGKMKVVTVDREPFARKVIPAVEKIWGADLVGKVRALGK